MNRYNFRNIVKNNIYIFLILAILLTPFVTEKNEFLYGLFFGTVFAITKYKMIEINVKKIINEKLNAKKSARFNYFIRFFVTFLVLLIAISNSITVFLGTCLGLFTNKLAILYTSFKK